MLKPDFYVLYKRYNGPVEYEWPFKEADSGLGKGAMGTFNIFIIQCNNYIVLPYVWNIFYGQGRVETI